jgi:hypothetical protein
MTTMSLTPAQQAAMDVLKTRTSFAAIGVSAQPEKYGHEVFETLYAGGYTVYPINPKYAEIDGVPCYPSLAALPEMPQVVVLALAPHVTEQVVPQVAAAGVGLIWLPPGCFTSAAVDAWQAAGVAELHDVRPVGAWRALQILQDMQ